MAEGDKKDGDALMRVLRTLHARGVEAVTAAQVAAELWPSGRTHNAHGQVFPLAAGVAGRMLRQSTAVVEVTARRWEIVPERLTPNAEVSGGRSPSA